MRLFMEISHRETKLGKGTNSLYVQYQFLILSHVMPKSRVIYLYK